MTVPCPWVRCRHHLGAGRASCSLVLAEDGPRDLMAVAALMGAGRRETERDVMAGLAHWRDGLVKAGHRVPEMAFRPVGEPREEESTGETIARLAVWLRAARGNDPNEPAEHGPCRSLTRAEIAREYPVAVRAGKAKGKGRTA